MKFSIKLHSVYETSPANKTGLQLHSSHCQFPTSSALFGNSLGNVGAFALQNQVLVLYISAKMQI